MLVDESEHADRNLLNRLQLQPEVARRLGERIVFVGSDMDEEPKSVVGDEWGEVRGETLSKTGFRQDLGKPNHESLRD
jgi:hypothetical protein